MTTAIQTPDISAGRSYADIASSAAMRAFQVVSYVAICIVLARWLGSDGYGAFSFAWSAMELAAVAALLGFDVLIIEKLPGFFVNAQPGIARRLIRTAIRIVCITSLAIAAVAIGSSWLSRDANDVAMMHCLRWSAIFLPFVTLMRLRLAALQGAAHVRLALFPFAIIQPMAVIAIIVGLRSSRGEPLSPQAATVSVGIAFVFAWLCAEIFYRVQLRAFLREPSGEEHGETFVRQALALSLVGGLHLVISRTDTIMLAVFVDDAAAGIYTIASRAAEMVVLVLIAANHASAPWFSRLFQQGDTATLRRVYRRGARLALLGAAAGLIVLFLFGFEILGLFGADFADGYQPMVILAGAQVFNAAIGGAGMLLLMTGHRKDVAVAVGVAAVVNLVLNAVLIPLYGMTGAASASAVSILIWNILYALRVRQRIGIRAGI